MARTYRDEELLPKLPMAMVNDNKANARTWFDSLPLETKNNMNASLQAWFDTLSSRYQANAGSAVIEVDNMTHRFENEGKEGGLTVRDYITKKQSLYIEAGEENKDLIVRRLHRGLDPMLAAAVYLRTDRPNTLNHFTKIVYNQEHTARASYISLNTSTTKKIKDELKAKAQEQRREPPPFNSFRRQNYQSPYQQYQQPHFLQPQQQPQPYQPRFIPRDAAQTIGRQFAQTQYNFSRGSTPPAPSRPITPAVNVAQKALPAPAAPAASSAPGRDLDIRAQSVEAQITSIHTVPSILADAQHR